MFKKLAEQIEVNKIVDKPVTLEERTEVEKEVIFGNLLEELEIVEK